MPVHVCGCSVPVLCMWVQRACTCVWVQRACTSYALVVCECTYVHPINYRMYLYTPVVHVNLYQEPTLHVVCNNTKYEMKFISKHMTLYCVHVHMYNVLLDT